MFKRVFLIVTDSLGVGQAKDADKFNDIGANTLGHILEGDNYHLPVFEKLGLTDIVKNDGKYKFGYHGKLEPANKAKDTLNGHYEMMGIVYDKPFMTYYMTVSGHMDYDFDGNSIASKNKNKVDNLPYSEEAKAYLATQIELDKALELLINKLEESNKLNDTIIVLLGDHYPYGLDLDTINELSTYKRDNLYEINHNTLIVWNNNLNTIKVDKVGMPIDVIPTVYNLFGVSYDSRLFAGTDLLSTSEGLAMLEDRSWITNKARYNSTTNSYEGSVDEDYIKNINNTIQNRITFSKDMLLKDGYKYIKTNDHSN